MYNGLAPFWLRYQKILLGGVSTRGTFTSRRLFN
jgi:hypothetical protein